MHSLRGYESAAAEKGREEQEGERRNRFSRWCWMGLRGPENDLPNAGGSKPEVDYSPAYALNAVVSVPDSERSVVDEVNSPRPQTKIGLVTSSTTATAGPSHQAGPFLPASHEPLRDCLDSDYDNSA